MKSIFLLHILLCILCQTCDFHENGEFLLFTQGIVWLSSGRFDTAVMMHYLDANKTAGEEARRQLHKNAARNIEQVLEATPNKAPT